jgi:adenylate cyclase
MPRLPDAWIALLSSGVSYRIAACDADGKPQMRRAMAAQILGDGRLEVLVPRQLGAALLGAVRLRREVALTVGHPQTNRTMQLKGRDAEVAPAESRHQALFLTRRKAFGDLMVAFGFPRERVYRLWFNHSWRDLDCVHFTPYGAWDQTPGIGAGGVIELVDAPLPPGADESAVDEFEIDDGGAAVAAATISQPATPLTLRSVRRVLDGIVPPSIATVSAEGVPHASFLSSVEYVDPTHVALTYQFFNRTRANLQATGRAALMVECPYSGARVLMQLRHRRTETEGPLFERLRAKLAGVAAHTGMEKVFRLLGADVFEVESLERNDTSDEPPGMVRPYDVAEGARALAARLAEVSELPQLVPVFMAGLRELMHVDNAILWLLDERRDGLYTLASLGYARSGVGSELALSDAGLAGVAIREGVPIRIGHMASMYRYGLAWRERAEGVGLQAVIARAIPLPGLERPGSLMAVPLRARGRTVGVLLVESDIESRTFTYDDEDALTLVGSQLAQLMAALQVAEVDAGAPARSAATQGSAAPETRQPSPKAAPAEPLQTNSAEPLTLTLRHWARDHTVFAGDDYLIKGVAGAILWRLATEHLQRGRSEFTTRELRLAGGDLGLPEVQDNLGVRLLLLERRLAERDCGIAIERAGRGRFRFLAARPLVLHEETGG